MLSSKFLTAVFLVAVPLALAAGAESAAAKPKKGKKGKKGKGSGSGEESSYIANYGMAGCGLGSILIKSDTTFMQISAASTNDSSYRSSAISSGSSNCDAVPPKQAALEQEVFLAANLRSLEKDVAGGGGDYSYAFAQVLGCDGDYEQFLDVSRGSYQTIFSSSDPKEVRARYLEAVHGRPELAERCSRVTFDI